MISDNQQGRILNTKEIMLQNIDLKSIVVHKSLNREQTKLFIENSLQRYARLHHFDNKVPNHWYLQFFLL